MDILSLLPDDEKTEAPDILSLLPDENPEAPDILSLLPDEEPGTPDRLSQLPDEAPAGPEVSWGNAWSGAQKLLDHGEGPMGWASKAMAADPTGAGKIASLAYRGYSNWDDQTEDEKASYRGVTAPAAASALLSPIIAPAKGAGALAVGGYTLAQMALGAGVRTAANIAEGDELGDAVYDATIGSPGAAAFDAVLGPVGSGKYSELAGALNDYTGGQAGGALLNAGGVAVRGAKSLGRGTLEVADGIAGGTKFVAKTITPQVARDTWDKAWVEVGKGVGWGGKQIRDMRSAYVESGTLRNLRGRKHGSIIGGHDPLGEFLHRVGERGYLDSSQGRYHADGVPVNANLQRGDSAGDIAPSDSVYSPGQISEAVRLRTAIEQELDDLPIVATRKKRNQLIAANQAERKRIRDYKKTDDYKKRSKEEKKAIREGLEKNLAEMKETLEKFNEENFPGGKFAYGGEGQRWTPNDPLAELPELPSHHETAARITSTVGDFLRGDVPSARSAVVLLKNAAAGDTAAASELGSMAIHAREGALRGVEAQAKREVYEALQIPDADDLKTRLVTKVLRTKTPEQLEKLLEDNPAANKDTLMESVAKVRQMQDKIFWTKRAAGVKQDISVPELLDRILVESDTKKLTQEAIDGWLEQQSMKDLIGVWTPEYLTRLNKLANNPRGAAFIKEAEGNEYLNDSGSLILDVLHRRDYGFRELRKRTDETTEEMLKRTHPAMDPAEMEVMLKNQGQRDIKEFTRRAKNADDFTDDLEKILITQVTDDAATIANAAGFGGQTAPLRSAANSGQGGRLGEVGSTFGRLINELPKGPAKDSADMAATRMYQREVGEDAKRYRNLSSMVSNSFLTKSALTSATEVGKSIWAVGGIRAWARGKAYVSQHPELMDLFEDYGAKRAPIVQLLVQSQGDVSRLGDAPGLPMELMGRVEEWLRSGGSVGSIDMIVRTAEKAGKVLKDRGDFDRRLLREASEIFPTKTPEQAAEYLGTQWNSTSNSMGLPAALVGEGVANLARRHFYTTSTGFAAEAMQTPGGAVAVQYKPFLVAAMRHLKTDIFDVLREAHQHKDAGLRNLGLNRLAGLLAYTMPAATGAVLIGDVIDGRMFTDPDYTDKVMGRVFQKYAATAGGGAGEIVSKVAGGQVEDLFEIPLVGFLGQAVGGTAEAVTEGDISKGVGALSTALSAFDPRVNWIGRPTERGIDLLEKD